MDLQWLRDIARTEGPFATVYLDLARGTPDADHATRLRWAELRGELERQGASAETVAALDEAIGATLDPETGAGQHPGQVFVAAGAKVMITEPLPASPDPPRASWSVLPDLLTALTMLPERVATVVAVVDKTGAEIYTGTHTEHLDTARYPMHKVRGGGYSHLSMQRRVEEHQRASAGQVAEAINTEVASTGAQLLVLAGEVRARSRVRPELNDRAQRILEEVEGAARGAGAEDDELDRQVAGLMDARVTRTRREEAERFEQSAGRDDGSAIAGVPAVVEAFQAAVVEALYLDAGAAPAAPIWISTEPGQLATRREDLEQLGLAVAGPVPASDALLRAAAGTGATFHLVGGGRTALAGRPMTDGIGAILRSAPVS